MSLHVFQIIEMLFIIFQMRESFAVPLTNLGFYQTLNKIQRLCLKIFCKNRYWSEKGVVRMPELI